MRSRKAHKFVGITLVLPMLGWIITGIIFFIKPGYKAAYEYLPVKTYPLETNFTIPIDKAWNEVRLIKTILGDHLFVKQNGKTEHLDPETLTVKPFPTDSEFNNLLQDAFTHNPDRYGEVVNVDGSQVITSTGVEVSVNWNSLTLRQKGRDTHLINLFYKIHYLQWTPYAAINQVIGIIGLVLLFTLTVLGVRVYLRK